MASALFLASTACRVFNDLATRVGEVERATRELEVQVRGWRQRAQDLERCFFRHGCGVGHTANASTLRVPPADIAFSRKLARHTRCRVSTSTQHASLSQRNEPSDSPHF